MNSIYNLNIHPHTAMALDKHRLAYHAAGQAIAYYASNYFKPRSALVSNNSSENSSYPALKRHWSYIGQLAAISPHKPALDNNPPSTFQPEQQLGVNKFSANESHTENPEADIISLLCGPMAEAKLIALSDDELFKVELFTIESLQYYHGAADMLRIDQHLQYYCCVEMSRRDFLTYCLRKAFNFVDHATHWQAIKCWADYFLHNDEQALKAIKLSHYSHQA